MWTGSASGARTERYRVCHQQPRSGRPCPASSQTFVAWWGGCGVGLDANRCALVTAWDPWSNLPNLPAEAPSRTMLPDGHPKPHQVQQRLAELGIDPESAGAIITAIFAK